MTSTEATAATARTSARAVTDVTRAHLDTSARAWYGSTMIETNAPARAIDAHRAHRVALDHVTTITTKRVDIDSPAWYDGNIEQTNTERVATMYALLITGELGDNPSEEHYDSITEAFAQLFEYARGEHYTVQETTNADDGIVGELFDTDGDWVEQWSIYAVDTDTDDNPDWTAPTPPVTI